MAATSGSVRVKELAPEMNARVASELMKALANESRLRILCELLEGERCVNVLERVVGLSQSALSQHLARLRRDGVVKTRRDGKTICYSLNGMEIAIVLETLYRLFSEDVKPGAASTRIAGKMDAGRAPSPR